MTILEVIEELKTIAEDAGASVNYGAVPTAFIYFPPGESWSMIGLPEGASPEQTVFSLAHEVGHLLLGHKTRSLPHYPREIQANHWAKKTLRERLSPALLETVLAASVRRHVDQRQGGRRGMSKP